MDLTIAICTYNRYDHLRRVLSALSALGYDETCEVLVVDNSDDVRAQAEFERSSLPQVTFGYLKSSPPGLSRARNVALAKSSRTNIAFLDDDAVPHAGWAEALTRALERPDVLCAGGPIQPHWEASRPIWMNRELEAALSLLDLGTQDRRLSAHEYFYGANIAFRRAAAVSVGGFDESLGRSGGNLIGDEETDIQRRLFGMGARWYAADAAVSHWIPAERCTLDWMFRRFAWQGVSDTLSADPALPPFHRSALDASSLREPFGPLLEELLRSPETPESALDRLQFVRSLVATSLSGQLAEIPHTATSPLLPPRTVGRYRQMLSETAYDSRQLIFVEFGVSHSYLYDVFGGLSGASLHGLSDNPWTSPRDCADYLSDLIDLAAASGTRHIVLLTLDYLFEPGYRDIALHAQARGISLGGFLHRAPNSASGLESLRGSAPKLAWIGVFSEGAARELGQGALAGLLHLVPHPPVFLRNAPPASTRRQRVGGVSSEARVIVSLLGECRPGKRFEWVVEALAEAPLHVRARLTLLLAGSMDPGTEARIRRLAKRAGLDTELHTVWNPAVGYRAIPDNLFAECIERSDVLCFPYDDDHRDIMSGHFVDGLISGASLLASSESYMGSLVSRFDLGATFSLSDPEAFPASLMSVIDRRDREEWSSSGRDLLLKSHGVQNVCQTLKNILDDC